MDKETGKSVVAICYDFDKTLSPDDMQAQGYIQSVGFDVPKFWEECSKLARENDMDQNLAYMYKMLNESKGKLVFNKKTLSEYGAKVKLFPGVEEWFDRIKEYGNSKGIIVEHYIISSGLKEMIESFDIKAMIVSRKKYYVLYIKEGSGIVDLLNIMEAPVSLMNLENLRIVKEMRNSINRRVNCEVANITKTVNAATKQIEDITYLRDHYGFENLHVNLREMAEVRLEHPDATLMELGQFLDPPVGKSGVNHRLRKLSELADKIKG